MTHKYGATVIPVPVAPPAGTFPFEQACGDVLLGYLGDYLRTVMETYLGTAWNSIHPGMPVLKNVFIADPDEIFKEDWLPALYLYRPGRETRELVETFEQVADDYRFQKGRIVARWIHDTAPSILRSSRNNIMDAARKIVDMTTQVGRDVSWKVPADRVTPPLDDKATLQGSSLANYAGFATLELLNAAPGDYIREMMAPAPKRKYAELHMSFYVEELLQRDLSLIGDPHEANESKYSSPDQGTGLGTFDLGQTIYR